MNPMTANQAFSGTSHQAFQNPARIVVNGQPHVWHAAVVQRLQELISLEKGWDGYAAPAVRFDNAYFTVDMLKAICPGEMPFPPQLVPGSSGDLQVEWHYPHGEIELHVLAPNSVRAWRRSPSVPEGEEVSLTTDFIVVWKWMKELLGAPLGTHSAAA